MKTRQIRISYDILSYFDEILSQKCLGIRNFIVKIVLRDFENLRNGDRNSVLGIRRKSEKYAKIEKFIEKNILEKYYATITLQSQT